MVESSNKTAEFFLLKIFKAIIIVFMLFALLIAIALPFVAGYFYLQKPNAPTPIQKAPDRQIGIDDFFGQMKSEAENAKRKINEAQEARTSLLVAEKVQIKYIDETKKLVGCVAKSNELVGVQPLSFSEDAIEAFRAEIQRLADDRKTRDLPYVNDSVRFICDIFLNNKFVEFRSKNKELRVLMPAVNYHVEMWDENKNWAREFDISELERRNRSLRAEEMRIGDAKAFAVQLLIGAATAFCGFMIIAISLIVASIETQLRRLATKVESFGNKPNPMAS